MYKKGSIHVELLLFVVVEVTSCPFILCDDGTGFQSDPWESSLDSMDQRSILNYGGEFEIVAHFFSLLKESAPRKMHNVHVWGSPESCLGVISLFPPSPSTRALCFLLPWKLLVQYLKWKSGCIIYCVTTSVGFKWQDKRRQKNFRCITCQNFVSVL